MASSETEEQQKCQEMKREDKELMVCIPKDYKTVAEALAFLSRREPHQPDAESRAAGSSWCELVAHSR